MWWSKAWSTLWPGALFFLLSLQSADSCPFRCQCHGNDGQVKVSCTSLSLTTVPVGLPHDTTILNLHGNLISKLSPEDFAKLPSNLTEINLGSNRISEVGENFLENLEQLTKLSLDSNQIQQLHPGSFQHLHKLRSLNLAKNHLGVLQADVFYGLEELHWLNLSTNAISSLDNSTFHDLHSLRILDLSFNEDLVLMETSLLGLQCINTLYLQGSLSNMSSLQALDGSTSLIYLDLSDNSIPYLNKSTFPKMPALQDLVLINSSIHYIEPNSFSTLPNLVRLTLDYNVFQEIWSGTFSSLSNLESLSLSNLPHLYYIYSNVFNGLNSLRVLLLSNNPQLTYLHNNLFHTLSQLTYLDLSYNNITRVHENVYNKFINTTVDLTGNSLTCDCELDWIVINLRSSSTGSRLNFQDQDRLTCSYADDISHEYPIWKLSVQDLHCQNLSVYSQQNSSVLFFAIGKSVTLMCDAEGHPSPTLTWILPRNQHMTFHNSHPLVHKEFPTIMEITETFHKHPTWHDSTSYRSDIENHMDRIIILNDGSLYIDYVLRSDAGLYTCVVQNSRSELSVQVTVRLDYTIMSEVKIMSYLVGLACATSFFMLNLIYALASALARRCINQRRRGAIVKLLENLDQYKSTQMSRLRDNYNSQLQRIRDTYHQRLERISTNYTCQVSRLRQGASNLREGASNKVGTIRGNYKSVRENYNNQLGKLRDYSSYQLEQLRDMYSNQVLKIRDYGSLQMGRFHHKYKLQQRHVIKLLEMMNVDNCRTVFETECVHAESMILSVPNLDDDPAGLSALDTISVSDEEYVTATSESSSHSSQEHLDFTQLLQQGTSGEGTPPSTDNEDTSPSNFGHIPDKHMLDADVNSKHIGDSDVAGVCDKQGHSGVGADRDCDKQGHIGIGTDRDKQGHSGIGTDCDKQGHSGIGTDRDCDKQGHRVIDTDRDSVFVNIQMMDVEEYYGDDDDGDDDTIV